MKRFWDPGISQTILFVFGAFTFVVAAFRTLATGGLDGLYDNYWLFMVSFGCIIWLRYLRQRQKEADLRAEDARLAEIKKVNRKVGKPNNKPKRRK
ncbi:hypothetical protein [Hymenobacter psychrophilus]|uniref:Uncharacterized protein n=1 Tax=Hymenobacter psychrophilus TaxID=651662 RepID=A0A1H3GIJ1_9BACT|nr:hypothetical protein [Hymenobacter psychrophilus]SDY02897.1 hypothetical protein SAMN04488069_10538 [Hymenobacter psychrophilus]